MGDDLCRYPCQKMKMKMTRKKGVFHGLQSHEENEKRKGLKEWSESLSCFRSNSLKK